MQKIPPEMKFPIVSYCLKNWEETQEMIQDGHWLMGFDNDKKFYISKPFQILVQIVTTTWSVKQDYAEIIKV